MTETSVHKDARHSTSRRQLARRRHGLVAGKLPQGHRAITASVAQLRRGLEAAVLDARGQVGIADAASVNTACRFETHALLCLRQLRDHYAKLSPTERAKLSEQHARASAERDRAIERLGLDAAGDFGPDRWPTARDVMPPEPPEKRLDAAGSEAAVDAEIGDEASQRPA